MTSTESPTTSAGDIPAAEAVYFDGRSSRKRRVTVTLGAALDIAEDGVVLDTWPLDTIRRADGQSERLRLSSTKALPLARLEIADAPMRDALVARAVSLDAGRERQTWRIAGWSLAAVASILVIVVYGVPLAAERLAPFVPRSFERRLGEAVDKQARAMFGGTVCTAAGGSAVFTVLINKLKQAGEMEDEPIDAYVIASPVPNAIALPGGKVYLFDGLLQRAQNVDEIAGVLAHELGHVRHRDNLRHMIQVGGTSFLVGLLFGDIAGGGAVILATRSLFNASYSRDVERDADAFAATVMRALGRSPKPMGNLLLRVSGPQAKSGLSILSSHPLTEERQAALARADSPASGPDILSPAQWNMLKTICGGPSRPAGPG